MVGREITLCDKLLVIEDPTRGIDVGAIEFIWEKILRIAAAGAGILLISHELNEVMQLSDRIFVMYNGTLESVSYTHLDVYKRQIVVRPPDRGWNSWKES